MKAVPYAIHTVMTDDDTPFSSLGNSCSATAYISRAMDQAAPIWAHAFGSAGAQNLIDHRLTKPCHPWTNGQVERVSWTPKEVTVKRFHYDTHAHLPSHPADFV